MTPRERARRGEGERLRQEIIEAAKQLLFDTGDEEAVTIRAVAKAVGVSPPSIYLHFGDKQALLLAVCEDTFAALDEFIEKAAAGIDDPVEELQARGRAYVAFGLENPEQYRILFMTRPTAMDQAELPAPNAFNHHLESVQRAADAGALAAGTDPVMAAMALWAGAHGITSLLIAKPDFEWPDRDQLVDHVLATVAKGLSR
jgi:AcrR family transcriptional regulator